jgi:hypothetical protein
MIGIEHFTNATKTCWFGVTFGKEPGGIWLVEGIGMPPAWPNTGWTGDKFWAGKLDLLYKEPVMVCRNGFASGNNA